jgi:hypothetical protein
MSAQTDSVTKFLAALKSGTVPAEMLGEDARFQALNVDLKGRDAVLERLTKGPGAAGYKEANWTAEEKGEAVQATGAMPNGARLTLTVHAKNGKIALVQQQMLPGQPRPGTELKIPTDLKERINNALAQRHPMLIAYSDESGQPILTFRGSTQVFSDTQLAIWVRNAGGSMIRSIQKHPKIAMMYRDEDAKATYNFRGRAHIDSSEAARRQVYDTMAQVERDHDFARLGVAMIIDLDLIEGYGGLSPQGQINPIRMQRAGG